MLSCFQDVRGLSPLPTGLLFLPMTVASIAGAWVGGRLVTATSVKTVVLAGTVLIGGGLLLMSVLPAEGTLGVVVAGMVVGAIGFMMVSVALTIAITAAAAADHRGLASGLLGTSTQLGNAVGLSVTVSVAVVVTAAVAESTPDVMDRLSGLRWGLWVSVVVAALTWLTALIFLRPGDDRSITGQVGHAGQDQDEEPVIRLHGRSMDAAVSRRHARPGGRRWLGEAGASARRRRGAR